MNKDFFKKTDFENRLKNANKILEKYLTDKNYELKELNVNELIQWHDKSPKGPREIYPHSDCPNEIKNIVNGIIEQEFK